MKVVLMLLFTFFLFFSHPFSSTSNLFRHPLCISLYFLISSFYFIADDLLQISYSLMAQFTSFQIICKPLALDDDGDPVILGLNAVSAALNVSNVPWNGPVGAVRIGLIDDKVIFLRIFFYSEF